MQAESSTPSVAGAGAAQAVPEHGGGRVAEVLVRRGVRALFTLCGGHISPILTAAKARGIRIVDVRDEASAVFAADAMARLTGVPGVAAVTAGPGMTNTVTAVKNAQLAQSPVVVLGGATGTILKGRGSLQDIDQQALMAPHVKWQATVSRVRDLGPTVDAAFAAATDGVPGPVFVECPVDLLYPEPIVRGQYGLDAKGGGAAGWAVRRYLSRHVGKLFAGARRPDRLPSVAPWTPPSSPAKPLANAAKALARARRPVLVIGSQSLIHAGRADAVAAAVDALGVPAYLSGMARGLLGPGHALHMRHKRRLALKEADVVVLCGVPCDFRLDYGRHIGRGAKLISVNLDADTLVKNRKPWLGVRADPGRFLTDLADAF
ncbi:MAG: thiamine pyrophosphate-binding protein, partial [Acidobacteriota bacterium]